MNVELLAKCGCWSDLKGSGTTRVYTSPPRQNFRFVRKSQCGIKIEVCTLSEVLLDGLASRECKESDHADLLYEVPSIWSASLWLEISQPPRILHRMLQNSFKATTVNLLDTLGSWILPGVCFAKIYMMTQSMLFLVTTYHDLMYRKVICPSYIPFCSRPVTSYLWYQARRNNAKQRWELSQHTCNLFALGLESSWATVRTKLPWSHLCIWVEYKEVWCKVVIHSDIF